MKKTWLVILVLPLLSAATAVQAQVYYSTNADGSSYEYSTNADGSVTIDFYVGPPWAVTIPTNINGLPVTVIGIGWESAFSTSLTSVTIPGSVTNIGDYAFQDCTSLANVTIANGSGPTSIGGGAFLCCTSLTSVTIGNSVTSIGGGAFFCCTNLTSVTLANGVTNIGGYAFADTSLTNVTIPGSVINIGDSAFKAGCGLVVEVAGAGSVTNIGDPALQDCSSLTSVYFEGNAPTADSTVFGGQNPTVYYLSGTMGWSDFSANTDLTPVLWNPLIQTGDASFGVQNNQFGFNITGTNNFTVVVEACTDLANSVWSPLQTVTLTNGSFHFSDPQWTNYPARFYGLVMP
jgi:hypothetical protein